MTRLQDITGTTYGRLTVVSRAENSAAGQTRWLCRCECGKEIITQGGALKDGHTKSCGCLSVDMVIKRSTKHGHSPSGNATKTYWSWCGMLARCRNPKHKSYAEYGGAGVTVCERWLDFPNFLADMGEKPAGKSIDREDGTKGYEPGNCRWATPTEQARNRRITRQITANGETRPLAEWCERLDLKYSTVADRLRSGWPAETALELNEPKLYGNGRPAAG